MEFTKTTVDIIKDKNGNAVNFDSLLQSFEAATTRVTNTQAQIAALNDTLTAEQDLASSIAATVTAVYGQYPSDVPQALVDAMGLVGNNTTL